MHHNQGETDCKEILRIVWRVKPLSIYTNHQRNIPVTQSHIFGYRDYSFWWFLIAMQIRRKIITDIKGQPMLQKALAFALLIKFKMGRDSTVPNWSINKLRTISGLSSTAIKKYLNILNELNWIRYEGKSYQQLTIKRIASHTPKRNINVDALCFDSFKDAYNSVRALIVMFIQSHKNFIKRTIQTAENPSYKDDYKSVRKTMKRLVKIGILNGLYEDYKEYGLSYKRIARETGNCEKTAFTFMQYAIDKGWIIKHNNVVQVYSPNVNYREVEGYTFSTKNNLYVIHANVYELPASIEESTLGIISL